MKKIIFLSSLIVLIACSSFTPPVHFAKSHPEKTATVYIFRGGQFAGALANWSIFANGHKICKLSNNKFIRETVQPGKIIYTAKLGGVSIMKKKTEVEIDAEAGKSYYVMCNVKQSITRSRMEMVEVTESTGKKMMAKMSEDNCEAKVN